ncbi:copper amine oxidase N-terminal domain-containing protein [Paenibacillus sp. WQ 127069]|uniref:Copper amine oxidase N-terminal domain-containing protein n=1 Tax=Paenibacillus baimaensis TaxID=2982185 RepID=A0ABT2UGA2_9BACL|nr:copper amine oxidase N-terminal domain-containing protein [Paenibacillus sp. WQ 127069]MCU6792699.1 copper amine oxidase N-terminal domain-containing protein [Paenibacillus sp. WQ 127069]
MRKSTTLALSGLLVFSFSTVVYASANIKEVSAYLNNGVKFMLKREAWTPYDADGIKQVAITYEGSTYLPLRSVAEATGLKVDWNDATNTIVMSKKETIREFELLSNRKISPFRDSDLSTAMKIVQSPITMFNKTYSSGLQFTLSPYTTYAPDRQNWLKNTEIDLGGQYRKLEAIVGVDDSSAADSSHSTVVISSVRGTLNQYRIKPGDKPRTVFIDVTNVEKLYVSFSNGAHSPQKINLLDAKLYR